MLTIGELGSRAPAELLALFGLRLVVVEDDAPIPGSFWGEPEAGIIGGTVYARTDTPIHSLCHESGHIVCMTPERRRVLERDAGGDDLEESAVCYLQVLMGDCLPGVGRERLMRDMDDWGYSFRLGSTSAWFADDAGDARRWLLERDLVTDEGEPTFRLRGSAPNCDAGGRYSG